MLRGTVATYLRDLRDLHFVGCAARGVAPRSAVAGRRLGLLAFWLAISGACSLLSGGSATRSVRLRMNKIK